MGPTPVTGGLKGYDPSAFAHLPVSAEIKELFQHIARYTPHTIELRTELKCFIPDYIPAVGDIDPMVKVRVYLVHACTFRSHS
jgi:intraflagellar transport protein 46